MLGKTECNRRSRQQRTRWLDSTTNSMEANLSNSGRQWRTERIRLKRSYQTKQAKQKDARGPHTNKMIWAPGPRLACCSVSQYCLTSWDHKDYSAPGIPVLHNLWELTQAHVHWIGDVIQPLCPLFSLLLLPSIFPSIRIFSNDSALCIRWPKNWKFNFSISSSNEYSGLISFRMDWLDLLAVQGTLKILLQHHSSKATILQCLAFFMVELSHPYMTSGKTIALNIQIFGGKVSPLLFNMLSLFVIAFHPRSKCLLIAWLLSPSAVILEAKKIKFVTVSIVSPSIGHEVMGSDAMIFIFLNVEF